MNRIASLSLGAALMATLVGCGQRELVLQGERHDIRTPLSASLPAGDAPGAARVLGPARDGVPVENRALAVSLPAERNLADWPQRSLGGTHQIPHLALSGQPQPLWVADIGQGNSRRHRITADPVVVDGRIFTLDSRARVTATSTAGATLWTADLTPREDGRDDASGGGLAHADGRLFVTSGFGTLTALDPASGQVLWTQRLEAAGNAAPTVAGGLVYIVGRDGRAWAIRATDGRVVWSFAGLPGGGSYVGGAGAATDGRIVVLPFSSGELTAVLARSGVRTWDAHVTGQRPGRAYAQIVDIAGDPVIVGRTVYAGNASGKLAAVDAGSGERLWTASEGTMGTILVAGGSLFVVSDDSELVRLDARDGRRIWGTALPSFEATRPKRLRDVVAHYGPLLAGGRLLVASTDGLVRLFDPVSGALQGSFAVQGGAASNPVIVGGTLYIVTGTGRLAAFR